MSLFKHIDWNDVFVPSVSLAEIFIRGSLLYLSLFFLLRLILKRQTSSVGVADLLVLVLIADASQNAMTGGYRSVTEGVFLVATIMFWSYALDWLGYHFRFLRRFLCPPPVPLIRNGKLLRRNLRKELITRGELMSQLREQGILDYKNVKGAYLEGDGEISVVTEDERPHKPQEHAQP